MLPSSLWEFVVTLHWLIDWLIDLIHRRKNCPTGIISGWVQKWPDTAGQDSKLDECTGIFWREANFNIFQNCKIFPFFHFKIPVILKFHNFATIKFFYFSIFPFWISIFQKKFCIFILYFWHCATLSLWNVEMWRLRTWSLRKSSAIPEKNLIFM